MVYNFYSMSERKNFKCLWIILCDLVIVRIVLVLK